MIDIHDVILYMETPETHLAFATSFIVFQNTSSLYENGLLNENDREIRCQTFGPFSGLSIQKITSLNITKRLGTRSGFSGTYMQRHKIFNESKYHFTI